MGAYTFNWCDRCGEQVDELTAFVFGKPSQLQYRDHRRETEAALCNDCIKAVQAETKRWTLHKDHPKELKPLVAKKG